MPLLGDASCVPVGIATCAKGFTRDARGWGCVPVVAKACAGATRAKLGESSCVDVGDCNAAFPPAGATHFVGPLVTVDATHFRTIAAALAAAPAGAVIAVDDGTYAESLVLKKPVTLAGRCAARVHIEGSGVGISAKADVGVSGVSLAGFTPALSVDAGTTTVRDAVFEDNTQSAIDVGPGASVDVAASVIRGTKQKADRQGYGVIFLSGTVAIRDSELSANTSAEVAGGGAGGELTLEDVVLRKTTPDANGSGTSLLLDQGGHARLVRVAAADATRFGLHAETGAELELEDVTVERTRAGRFKAGMGLAVSGGRVHARRLTLLENEGIGLAANRPDTDVVLEDSVVAHQRLAPTKNLGTGVYQFSQSTVKLVRSAVVGNRSAGLECWTEGTTASLERSLVADTLGIASGEYGDGLVVSGGRVEAAASAFVGNRQAGLYAAIGGSLSLKGSVVRGTLAETFEGRLGNAVMALDAGAVSIDGSLLEGSASGGLVVDNSRVLVSRSTLRKNTVGVHAQGTAALHEVERVPTSGTDPGVFVSADTLFLENGARVGTGTLSIPPPVSSF